jgi:putative membrane protein
VFLLRSALQGVLLGIVIIMPGMSGGTALVILGMFDQIVRDIARLRLAVYIPLICGLALGIYLGGVAFARLLIFHRDLTAAFFLGVILASLKVILKGRPFWRVTNLSALIAGVLIGYLMAGEPIGVLDAAEVNPFILFTGGALSSAVMLIPGVPGSAVLIAMGIYDDMFFLVDALDLPSLFIFGIGGALGIFLLARLLEKYYARHQDFLSFLFAGLILGSARTLLPQVINSGVVVALLVGALLVWYVSEKY